MFSNILFYVSRVFIISLSILYVHPTYAEDAWSIHQAIIDSDIDEVKRLISVNPQWLEVSGFGTGTPLQNASSNGKINAAVTLIELGADVNAVGEFLKGTALQEAVRNGHSQLVRMLLENGSDVNAINEKNETALFISIIKKNIEIIKLLVNSGADVNHENNFGFNPLTIAISTVYEDDAVSSLLASRGAEVQVEKIAVHVCSRCHVANKDLENVFVPYLESMGTKYMIKQLDDYKSGKRTNFKMTRFSVGMTQEITQTMVSYYSAIPSSSEDVDQSLIEPGRAIYQYSIFETGMPACSGCHGINGGGLDLSLIPKISGQKETYLRQALKEFQSSARSNDPNMVMRLIAQKLSDIEIKQLAAFLASRP